ncbi:MAG: VanZ family protein [Planctomycetaceae bacterium]
MKRRRLLVPALFAAWLALIFATSCTVVRPQEFFDLLHRHVFTDTSLYERFKLFWGLSWFTIVKGWHATEFAIAWLCVRAFAWWNGAVTRPAIIAGMVFCSVFAISDEWHQSFVPDREGTVTDVLIDGLGILLSGMIMIRRHGQSTAVVTTSAEGDADDRH